MSRKQPTPPPAGVVKPDPPPAPPRRRAPWPENLDAALSDALCVAFQAGVSWVNEERPTTPSDLRAARTSVVETGLRTVRNAWPDVAADVAQARPWTYCADALPAPPGSRLYETSRISDSIDGDVGRGVQICDISLWDGSRWRDFGVYAWREIALSAAAPLRPFDRACLLAQGVPPIWLPLEERK